LLFPFITLANFRHISDCVFRNEKNTVTTARSTFFAREAAVAKITIKFDKYRARTTVADSMCSSGCFCFIKATLPRCRSPPLSETLLPNFR